MQSRGREAREAKQAAIGLRGGPVHPEIPSVVSERSGLVEYVDPPVGMFSNDDEMNEVLKK